MRRWWDLLIVLALVALTVVEVVTGSGSSEVARLAFAVPTIAGLLVRQRLPLVSAGIVTVGLVAQAVVLESPEEAGILLAVVIAAYSLAAHAPTRDTVTGTVLMGLGVAVAVALDPSDSVSNIPPTLLLFVGLPVGIGRVVHRRQRDLEGLRLESAARATEAAEAVEAERRRIARELHDVVSHAVTVIAVQAEAGQAVIRDDPAAAERSLAAIAAASRDALIELDRMLRLLRDAGGTVVDTDAGLERVPALVEGARAAGLDVELSSDVAPGGVTAATEACAFRVVQEGLTNALRHAPGSRVRVRLTRVADDLAVSVETSGRRRATSYGGSGRGLAGLRERVATLGGSLRTSAADNGDFLLEVSLPGTAA